MSEQSKTIHFELPATLEALAQLDDKVRAVMVDPQHPAAYEAAQYNFVLALHELCTNIVEHAYADSQGDIKIAITMESRPTAIRAEVVDFGAPFDQKNVTAPNLDEPQEGGYGLFLMAQLLDEVQYTRHQSRNEWRLLLRLT